MKSLSCLLFLTLSFSAHANAGKPNGVIGRGWDVNGNMELAKEEAIRNAEQKCQSFVEAIEESWKIVYYPKGMCRAYCTEGSVHAEAAFICVR
jgi:hypothetical protein